MLQLTRKKSFLWLLLALYCSYSIANRASQRYLCGKILDEALELACPNGFQPKLSNNGVVRNMLPSPYKRLSGMYYNGTRQPSLLMMRRARRGVYQECCLKICTELELSSYCQTY